MTGALEQAVIYLTAAVVAVPVAKRLGLGSVLGYLLAGILIGPTLGLVGSETQDVKHFAEFGVVMMLFLVGLELQPRTLWNMRARLLGLGGLQVTLTLGLITGVGLALGLDWQNALATGLILSLSSTAIVLQTLNEKGLMKSSPGRSSFAVLLFQDIAVIPMLAVLPLLATREVVLANADAHEANLLDGLPGWAQTLAIFAAMAGIVLVGRYSMRPLLRFIAASRLREIFTAAALLLVTGVALLMTKLGLSPALGTFLAGVVLSDSEYRHELESDIEPFKGLLLGLFFVAVGAGVDFGLLAAEPGQVLLLAGGLMLGKAVILALLGRIFGLRGADNALFALGLCQAGEFGFVLLAFADNGGVLPVEQVRILTLVVALTMLLTPLAFLFHAKVLAPRAVRAQGREPDPIDEVGTAIVAGVGRFGIVVSRLLSTNGYRVVVLDQDPALVELLRRIGIHTYYGDATRPDLLDAAGIAEARLFVAALDDREAQTTLVEHVRKHHPKCRIVARAVDQHHVYELERAGAHHIEREVFESALRAGRDALIELGEHPFKAERQSRAFRLHDLETLEALRESWNEAGVDGGYVDVARARAAGLSNVMKSDRMAERHDGTERGWTPPPKSGSLD